MLAQREDPTPNIQLRLMQRRRSGRVYFRAGEDGTAVGILIAIVWRICKACLSELKEVRGKVPGLSAVFTASGRSRGTGSLLLVLMRMMSLVS